MTATDAGPSTSAATGAAPAGPSTGAAGSVPAGPDVPAETGTDSGASGDGGRDTLPGTVRQMTATTTSPTKTIDATVTNGSHEATAKAAPARRRPPR